VASAGAADRIERRTAAYLGAAPAVGAQPSEAKLPGGGASAREEAPQRLLQCPRRPVTVAGPQPDRPVRKGPTPPIPLTNRSRMQL